MIVDPCDGNTSEGELPKLIDTLSDGIPEKDDPVLDDKILPALSDPALSEPSDCGDDNNDWAILTLGNDAEIEDEEDPGDPLGQHGQSPNISIRVMFCHPD
jgi:hypothetical protein